MLVRARNHFVPQHMNEIDSHVRHHRCRMHHGSTGKRVEPSGLLADGRFPAEPHAGPDAGRSVGPRLNIRQWRARSTASACMHTL